MIDRYSRSHNASANDTQTTKLAQCPNSFEREHRVRCFNHTLNLVAKAILKPFSGVAQKAGSGPDLLAQTHMDSEDEDNEVPLPDTVSDSEDEHTGSDDEGNGTDSDSSSTEDDDTFDAFDTMDEADQQAFLEAVAAVKTTLTKVRASIPH